MVIEESPGGAVESIRYTANGELWLQLNSHLWRIKLIMFGGSYLIDGDPITYGEYVERVTNSSSDEVEAFSQYYS